MSLASVTPVPVQPTHVGWDQALTSLEVALEEGELMVALGRLEELRVPPVPVVAAGLPPELAARARVLQERVADLTQRVSEALAATRRELEDATHHRADRQGRTEPRAGRQWHPAFVDARA